MEINVKFLDDFDERTVKLQLYPLINRAVGDLMNRGFEVEHIEVRSGCFGIDDECSYGVTIWVDPKPSDVDFRIDFQDRQEQ